MFDAFKSAFRADSAVVESTESDTALSVISLVGRDVGELLIQHGGRSFNRGIYRIINFSSITHWNDMVLSAFPSFSNRITCFAIDWLGRVFALDTTRLEGGRPGVLMFEPGTGEALEIPCNIETFHESELIQYREEALAESFYQHWLDDGGMQPAITQCVGYKKPLFLGGRDTVDNLEVADLDVYWTVSAQLIQKTRGLPLGASIGKITIE